MDHEMQPSHHQCLALRFVNTHCKAQSNGILQSLEGEGQVTWNDGILNIFTLGTFHEDSSLSDMRHKVFDH